MGHPGRLAGFGTPATPVKQKMLDWATRARVGIRHGYHMLRMKRQTLALLVVGFGLMGSMSAVAQDQGGWRAVSSTAKAITGDVAFLNGRISINYLAFPIAEARVLHPEEVSAVFDLEGDAIPNGKLYRLNVPAATKFQHKNTLCGSDNTEWVVTYVSGRNLQLAFFSGEKAPVFTRDAISNSTDLCGTYTYGR
jgi:hypothetical protein